MARKRVAVTDEEINAALSKKAAKILGEEPTPEAASKPKPTVPISKTLTIKIIVGLLVFIVVVALIFLIKDRITLQGKVDKLSSTSSSPAQDETQELVDRLNKFMELPSDEKPTLATVSDVESLRTQTFFKNAQNGDKVLLYATAGKAILYRPSTQKVIEVSALNTSTNTTKQ